MTRALEEPPPFDAPARGEVHVWWAIGTSPPTGVTVDGPDAGWRSRSQPPRAAAERAHGSALRDEVLAAYLGLSRHEVPDLIHRRCRLCGSRTHGKPRLGGREASRLGFSLSRSAGRVAVAVSSGADVGVDLEAVRDCFDHLQVARRWCTETELEDLRSLPPERRAGGFHQLWTRKEALVKAWGVGLGMELGSLGIERGGVRRSVGLGIGGPWSVADVHVEPGYRGAAALEGPSLTVRTFVLRPGAVSSRGAPPAAPGLARAAHQRCTEAFEIGIRESGRILEGTQGGFEFVRSDLEVGNAGQRTHRTLFEHLDGADGDADLGGVRRDPHAAKGIATELEEVVVEPDLGLEHVRPDQQEDLFELIDRVRGGHR